ncbi:MAG TPA: DUF6066 family protein [Anaeromyxobacteraceae bacterium]|nr:DUF6066 family protein [Anaeromyxobacteraceae bacterium]
MKGWTPRPASGHDGYMTLCRSIALLCLILPSLVRASDDRFQSLRDGAHRLDNLSSFLERYLGSCKDEQTRSECERELRSLRRNLDREIYLTSIAEQTLEIVRPERVHGGYRFVVTPFIDGGGIALTHGAPRRQDAAGRPLIDFVVLDGKLPPGMDEMALESALRTGRLELEIVFRPEGIWRLKRKGQPGFYEGVKSRFLGLRLLDSRSGAQIASKVL